MKKPHSDKLYFHLASESDIDWLMSLWMNKNIMKFISGGAMNADKALSKSKEALGIGKQGLGYWIIRLKEDGPNVGYVVLRPCKWDENFDGVEVGFIIDEKFWNKGIASDAALAVSNFGLHYLKIKSIFALVGNKNIASINVVSRIGFKKLAVVPKEYPECSIWELKS